MHLLLLPGALGAITQLTPLAEALSSLGHIHLLNFPGHGGELDSGKPWTIATFTRHVLHWLDREELDRVAIFGYSMGGYVALNLAHQHPERVSHVATLATKFAWSPEAAAHETKALDADALLAKVPAFAQTLQERHAPADWRQVLASTAHLMRDLGENPVLNPASLGAIPTSVQVMVGDRDKMVSLEETVAAYRALPNARLAVLPSTAHPIEKVDVATVAGSVLAFFSK